MPAWFPHKPLRARADRALIIRTRVKNVCLRPFPKQATYGRRLVRLGAQLCDDRGSVLERDSARAWLPETLKFDLVSEGIDWFEACGSPTTTKPLVVD